jgi:serine-type D-Ala-D-Ala carboxypeptidase (penicillin-binding protein 5/6)
MIRSLLAVLLVGMVPASSLPEDVKNISVRIDVARPRVDIGETPEAILSLHRKVSASGILITDLESGQKLYAYAANVRRPMASLTKLMTALIIVENHTLDEMVYIPDSISEVEGNVAWLKPHHSYSVGDLLSALLVVSANDAALTFALYHSGSEDAFVYEMNQRAHELGLKDSHFSNSTGLDMSNQWSTPRDLTWLFMHVLRHEEIAARLSQRRAVIKSTEGQVHRLTHTHALLHGDQPYLLGKTGTTLSAKQCLLSVIEWEGRKYVVIILHSANRYRDMRFIFETMKQTFS